MQTTWSNKNFVSLQCVVCSAMCIYDRTIVVPYGWVDASFCSMSIALVVCA